MKIAPPVEESRTELSVVPLVNVVFLLLVFFMLVGQITSPEPLEVDPPVSEIGTEETPGTAKVLLTRDGRVAVDGVVLAEADLTGRVADMLADRPATTFQIKADADTDAVRLIRIMERLRSGGVEKLTLLTELKHSR